MDTLPPEDKLRADDRVSSRKPTEQSTKEWRLIEKVMLSSQKEQKSARRWGIFFKSLTFIYLFAALYIFSPFMKSSGTVSSEEHAAIVDVQGIIADGAEASAANINAALRDAFKSEQSKGIILNINSPGGSPVQAGYVYDEITRLKQLNPEKKVYAVISDLGASGAYYIAAAADEIYADKASLVGSIGVIAGNFGYVELIEKLGVERRVFTAGEHKGFLDPFLPLKEDEKGFWESVLNTTHNQFIDEVKKGRGNRLATDKPEIFSGLVWTGEQAVELGLIDGLKSPSQVARDNLNVENTVNYTPALSPLDKIVDRFAVTFGESLASQLGLTGHAGLQLK